MRLPLTLLTLGFALSTIAATTPETRWSLVVERDVATLVGVISDIQTQLDNLNATINAYTGGTPAAILASFASLISTINSDIPTVEGTSAINTTSDYLKLAAPLGQLINTGFTPTLNNLISKEPQLLAACEGPTVLDSLQQQNNSINALTAALSLQVPGHFQHVVAVIAALTYENSITAFENTPPCSSSSSTSTTIPTTTTITTSTTATTSTTFPTSTTVPISSTTVPTSSMTDSAYISVITNIEGATQDLITAIEAYQGGPPTAVQSASDAVVSITNAGIQIVNAQVNLTNDEAEFDLTPVILNLTALVNQSVYALIEKKPLIDAAGAGYMTLTNLLQQNTSASALAVAIIDKIPPGFVHDIAISLSAGITNAIGVGISAYAGETPPTTSTSSTSPTSSTTSTSLTSLTSPTSPTKTASSTSPTSPTTSTSPTASTAPTSTTSSTSPTSPILPTSPTTSTSSTAPTSPTSPTTSTSLASPTSPTMSVISTGLVISATSSTPGASESSITSVFAASSGVPAASSGVPAVSSGVPVGSSGVLAASSGVPSTTINSAVTSGIESGSSPSGASTPPPLTGAGAMNCLNRRVGLIVAFIVVLVL